MGFLANAAFQRSYLYPKKKRDLGAARPIAQAARRRPPVDVDYCDRQVLTIRRLARRAFAFAGRLPWFAFLTTLPGLAILYSFK